MMPVSIADSGQLQDRSLELTLRPVFGEISGHVESLAVTIKVKGLSYKPNEPILTHPLQIYGVPNNIYDGDAIKAVDAEGPLSLCYDENDSQPRSWYCSRSTKGNQIFSFEAFPREVNQKTPPGGRTDLRKDLEGGLTGAGISFIPLPPSKESDFKIKVHWDLSNTPSQTKAVWSFGEWGPNHNDAVEKRGPGKILLDTVYAVGPLNDFTTCTPLDDGRIREYGFYWFGQPTLFDAPAIAKEVESVFNKMAQFFEDTELSYRVVVRFNPVRGFGGGAFLRSFILEYDPFVELADGEMLSLLIHEMVHNWPRMQGSANEISQDEATWFIEGVADYYSIILPYRLGIYNKQEYLRYMNMEAMRYYTNPLVSISNDKAVQLAGKTSNASTLFYNRGCMHLIDINAKIIATNRGRTVDDVILEFHRLKKTGRPHGLAQWLELMTKEEVPHAVDEYNRMAAGELIIPATDSLGREFELVRKDMEQFSLGFSEEAFGRCRVIADLEPQSRAALAGLRDGDSVIRNTFMFQSQEYFEKELTLIIERDGKELEVSFWPRTLYKVECWQWRSVWD